MGMQFSTDTAPSHRRLALWQDIVCDVFVELDCRSDLGEDFHGTVHRTDLGVLACTEVVSNAQRVARTRSRIARSRNEFILVALGRRGEGMIRQDDRDLLLHPGEFAYYDTTRPYELGFEADFSQTIFQIPRACLQQRVRGLESLTAMAFDGRRPLARIALDFLHSLAACRDELDADTAARLGEQAADLIALAIADRLGQDRTDTTSHRAALLYRIKQHIRAHLSDPDLSLGESAAALGISPRYLNKLFADEGRSFQRHVLEQRLALARRDLSSPQQAHRQIGEIAFAWGFNDLSHFGRAFRSRYGVSPRDFREQRGRSETNEAE